MIIGKRRDVHEKIKGLAIGTVALLTMTVPMFGTAVAQEEVLQGKFATELNTTNFDMSFVDPTLGRYFLADRSNNAIQVVQTGSIPQVPPFDILSPLGTGAFVGVANGGNSSGPNGVITANDHTEVWAGDGPSIDFNTGLTTSHVVVIDIASNTPTHKIDTGGVMRAAKLCEDPKQNLVLVANDDPQDRFLSFISTNGYKVVGKIQLNGSDPNGDFVRATNATNAIGQCQWDSFTNNFYVAVPEVGGPGDNSFEGAVLVIDPKHMKVTQVFAVDHSICAGPQGLAIGPSPQILLGCTGVGPAPYSFPQGSVVINAITGITIVEVPLVNGVDEVWYNPGDNSYYLAANNNTNPLGQLAPIIGVVDAVSDEPPTQAPNLDQTFATAFPGVSAMTVNNSAHSIAVDPSLNIVYVMSSHVSGGPFGLCAFSCLDFLQPVGMDDPGVGTGKTSKK
jgi:hypothetical protein